MDADGQTPSLRSSDSANTPMTSPGSRPMSTMNLISLNEDVLLLICSFLDSRHARALCLVSKRTRRVAFKFALSSAECSTPEQLHRLTSYMLSPEQGSDIPRAVYLKTLVLHRDTFIRELLPSGKTRSSFSISPKNASTQAHLLADLLAAAQSLTTLYFKCFQPCLIQCPSIATALALLPKLTSLSLFTISDDTLAILGDISSHIRYLTLSYAHEASMLYLPDQSASLTPLLSALMSFRKLDTLTLRHFTPDSISRSASTVVPLSFPSIRNLHFEEVSILAFEIVECCPNLVTLSFSYSTYDVPGISTGPQWRPLRQVTVSSATELQRLVNRLSSVDILYISGREVLQGPPHDDAALAIAANLAITNPISLRFALRYSPNESNPDITLTPLWKQMAHNSPRLRSFELDLEWKTSDRLPDRDWGWILVRLSFDPPAIPGSDNAPRRAYPPRSRICQSPFFPSSSILTPHGQGFPTLPVWPLGMAGLWRYSAKDSFDPGGSNRNA